MSPATIRDMFPEFQKYGDQSFRSALSRMKTATGFNVRDDDPDEVVDVDAESGGKSVSCSELLCLQATGISHSW